jgi:hypothetical protein
LIQRLNVFPNEVHHFIHKQNKVIDETACTGEIWYKPNTVNERNVYIHGQAKNLGINIIGKHDNLTKLYSSDI